MTSSFLLQSSGTGKPFLFGFAALWCFSAAVSAMETPGASSSSFYVWLYRFTHLLAANLDKAALFQGAQQLQPGEIDSQR